MSFVLLLLTLFGALPTIAQGEGRVRRKELFIFATSKDNWKFYDWSKITTIVEFGFHSDDLLAFAHNRNVTVSYAANFASSILHNQTSLKKWVDEQIAHMRQHNLDGVNIDFEDEINCTDYQARNSFTSLMQLLKVELKQFKADGQLSIDVAWSPNNIDNRCYDYHSLATYANIVFVMSYDQRSQIVDGCFAGPNSAYNLMVEGIKGFVSIGISKEKLVLGVPWYGYDYPCINYFPALNKCEMKEVPFRGVPCSDAAGFQIGYTTILKFLSNQSYASNGYVLPFKRHWIMSQNWDDVARSPFFTYEDQETLSYHQVWYDNYPSLSLKYSFAISYGLAGVGCWEADSLEYSNTEHSRISRAEMWDALPDPYL